MKYDTQVIRLGTVAIKVLVLVLLALISVLVGMLLQRADSLPELNFKAGYTQDQLAPNSIEVDAISTFAATLDAVDAERNVLEVTLLGGNTARISYLEGTVFVQEISLTDDEIQAAEQAYQEALVAGDASVPQLPQPTRQEELVVTDLQSGDEIFVTVTENALEQKTLTAERVVVSRGE